MADLNTSEKSGNGESCSEDKKRKSEDRTPDKSKKIKVNSSLGLSLLQAYDEDIQEDELDSDNEDPSVQTSSTISIAAQSVVTEEIITDSDLPVDAITSQNLSSFIVEEEEIGPSVSPGDNGKSESGNSSPGNSVEYLREGFIHSSSAEVTTEVINVIKTNIVESKTVKNSQEVSGEAEVKMNVESENTAESNQSVDEVDKSVLPNQSLDMSAEKVNDIIPVIKNNVESLDQVFESATPSKTASQDVSSTSLSADYNFNVFGKTENSTVENKNDAGKPQLKPVRKVKLDRRKFVKPTDESSNDIKLSSSDLKLSPTASSSPLSNRASPVKNSPSSYKDSPVLVAKPHLRSSDSPSDSVTSNTSVSSANIFVSVKSNTVSSAESTVCAEPKNTVDIESSSTVTKVESMNAELDCESGANIAEVSSASTPKTVTSESSLEVELEDDIELKVHNPQPSVELERKNLEVPDSQPAASGGLTAESVSGNDVQVCVSESKNTVQVRVSEPAVAFDAKWTTSVEADQESVAEDKLMMSHLPALDDGCTLSKSSTVVNEAKTSEPPVVLKYDKEPTASETPVVTEEEKASEIYVGTVHEETSKFAEVVTRIEPPDLPAASIEEETSELCPIVAREGFSELPLVAAEEKTSASLVMAAQEEISEPPVMTALEEISESLVMDSQEETPEPPVEAPQESSESSVVAAQEDTTKLRIVSGEENVSELPEPSAVVDPENTSQSPEMNDLPDSSDPATIMTEVDTLKLPIVENDPMVSDIKEREHLPELAETHTEALKLPVVENYIVVSDMKEHSIEPAETNMEPLKHPVVENDTVVSDIKEEEYLLESAKTHMEPTAEPSKTELVSSLSIEEMEDVILPGEPKQDEAVEHVTTTVIEEMEEENDLPEETDLIKPAPNSTIEEMEEEDESEVVGVTSDDSGEVSAKQVTKSEPPNENLDEPTSIAAQPIESSDDKPEQSLEPAAVDFVVSVSEDNSHVEFKDTSETLANSEVKIEFKDSEDIDALSNDEEVFEDAIDTVEEMKANMPEVREPEENAVTEPLANSEEVEKVTDVQVKTKISEVIEPVENSVTDPLTKSGEMESAVDTEKVSTETPEVSKLTQTTITDSLVQSEEGESPDDMKESRAETLEVAEPSPNTGIDLLAEPDKTGSVVDIDETKVETPVALEPIQNTASEAKVDTVAFKPDQNTANEAEVDSVALESDQNLASKAEVDTVALEPDQNMACEAEVDSQSAVPTPVKEPSKLEQALTGRLDSTPMKMSDTAAVVLVDMPVTKAVPKPEASGNKQNIKLHLSLQGDRVSIKSSQPAADVTPPVRVKRQYRKRVKNPDFLEEQKDRAKEYAHRLRTRTERETPGAKKKQTRQRKDSVEAAEVANNSDSRGRRRLREEPATSKRKLDEPETKRKSKDEPEAKRKAQDEPKAKRKLPEEPKKRKQKDEPKTRRRLLDESESPVTVEINKTAEPKSTPVGKVQPIKLKISKNANVTIECTPTYGPATIEKVSNMKKVEVSEKIVGILEEARKDTFVPNYKEQTGCTWSGPDLQRVERLLKESNITITPVVSSKDVSPQSSSVLKPILEKSGNQKAVLESPPSPATVTPILRKAKAGTTEHTLRKKSRNLNVILKPLDIEDEIQRWKITKPGSEFDITPIPPVASASKSVDVKSEIRKKIASTERRKLDTSESDIEVVAKPPSPPKTAKALPNLLPIGTLAHETATPMPAPVSTPIPASVQVPIPTPQSAQVSAVVATAASAPVSTPTPVAVPTPTPVAVPTLTPVEVPTSTPVEVPTPTPVAVLTPTSVAVPTPTPVAVPTTTSVTVPTLTPVAVPITAPLPVTKEKAAVCEVTVKDEPTITPAIVESSSQPQHQLTVPLVSFASVESPSQPQHQLTVPLVSFASLPPMPQMPTELFPKKRGRPTKAMVAAREAYRARQEELDRLRMLQLKAEKLARGEPEEETKPAPQQQAQQQQQQSESSEPGTPTDAKNRRGRKLKGERGEKKDSDDLSAPDDRPMDPEREAEEMKRLEEERLRKEEERERKNELRRLKARERSDLVKAKRLRQKMKAKERHKMAQELRRLQLEEKKKLEEQLKRLPQSITGFDDETRMSAENSQAANMSFCIGMMDEDSSGAANDSSQKAKKSRMEVTDTDSQFLMVDQIAEYQWPIQGGELYMIQEQVSNFLGVKSFKRKYPDIKRRPVDLEERAYLVDSGLVSETLCDLGITAVCSSEVLDIMCSDFPDKYEEFRKYMRDKQMKELSFKQKAWANGLGYKLLMADGTKQDLKKRAMEAASNWNSALNKSRSEDRRCHMDLQTFIVHYPKTKGLKMSMPTPKIGSYPVSILPGQFCDFYKEYTSTELRYLPVNTVLYGPLKHPSAAHNGDGSQTDSDDSSSSDESSSTTSEDTQATEDTLEDIEKDMSLDDTADKFVGGATDATFLDESKDQVQQELLNGRRESTANNDGSVKTLCKVCLGDQYRNKMNVPEVLISCSQCGSTNHPTCLDLELNMVPQLKSYNWQCPDCKSCARCKENTDEDKMLFCDTCDRGYHIYCVGLKKVPAGNWQCQECTLVETNVCSNGVVKKESGLIEITS